MHERADAESEAITEERAEAALDRLVDAGAVDEAEDGTLTTTAAFEDVRRVYHDTYAHMDDEGIYETVSDLFGLTRAEAAEAVEDGGVTVEEVVAYLSARSFLDDRGAVPDEATVAVMARLLVEIGPGTPVPDAVPELDDDSYGAFLTDHPDAVITVWKHHCDPCEAMKADLDAVLAAVPDGVAVAGVDGESVPAFRTEFEVDVAPAVLAVRDGELQARLTGRQSPAAIESRFDDVYGDGKD
jgi:thiol-disulfide isomerase/thioredoxin